LIFTKCFIETARLVEAFYVV